MLYGNLKRLTKDGRLNMDLLYEGKAKQIYSCSSPDEVMIKFKDQVTALNGAKKDCIDGKGRVNLAFTRHFFSILKNVLDTHVVSFIDDSSFIAKSVKIIPLEVVVRNYAAGSICKRLGYERGQKFDSPVVEFFLKDDDLGDPIMSEEEILSKQLVTLDELNKLKEMSLVVNTVLSLEASKNSLILVDFKLEFGKDSWGKIILADEISPDTCRFWDRNTMESLDKDVYREEKGDLIQTYVKLANRLGVKL